MSLSSVPARINSLVSLFNSVVFIKESIASLNQKDSEKTPAIPNVSGYFKAA